MPESQNLADLLARVKPRLAEQVTQLCMRDDLYKAHQEAVEALNQSRATDATSPRMATAGTSAETKRLAEDVQRIEDEIADNAIRFTLRALPKDTWQALCAKHPPRKADDLDRYAGYNRDAVLDAAVRMCVVDPAHDDESWEAFVAVCNPSEWAELRNCVQIVNQAVTDLPKSRLASQILASPVLASKPQPVSE